MRFTNISLFALIVLFSVAVNAQVDDNPKVGDDDVIPRPGDDRVVQPPVGQEPGDDNIVPRPGDDRGGNGTTTTTRPSPTAVPTNAAMKNSMGTLGMASFFAYFML